MEKKLLAAILYNRTAFDKLYPHLSDKDFSDKGRLLYKLIEDFYNCDSEATHVDKDILSSTIKREYPRHAEQFIETIESLQEVSVPNLLKELNKLKRSSIGTELANALLNGTDHEIDRLIAAYIDCTIVETSEDPDEETVYNVDLEEFFNDNNMGDKIPFAPKELNKHLNGGVLRGHHIIIYAQPEVGKSLFTVNLAAFLCKKGYKVLYIANEEPIRDLLLRFLTRMTGMTADKVRKSFKQAQKRADKKGLSNLILRSASPGTPKEIESLVTKYVPDIVIADQMMNINMPGCEPGTLESLARASIFMRSIGKKYDVVAISVTQAGEDAKLILETRHIYQSKTAVPATADLMIGIGTNNAFTAQNRRMINLPKNKISGKHVHFPVDIDETLSKVTSI